MAEQRNNISLAQDSQIMPRVVNPLPMPAGAAIPARGPQPQPARIPQSQPAQPAAAQSL
jgi:hypothetical protein